MFGTLALAALLAATQPSPQAHGPIAIYQPALIAPIETAGTDLHPLVRAKLTIDETGRVTRVDVGAVEPSSPLDEVYRESARTALSAWRFAPAEKDGQAVASDASLAIQFHPFQDQARPSAPTSGAGPGFEAFRYEYRGRVLLLPAALRRKLADAIAATAERLLKKESRAVASDAWFEVVTDFGGQKQADSLLHNVEAAFVALNGMLGEKLPAFPREDRIRVYVFGTNQQYQTLVSQVSSFEGSAGFYSPAGVLAFHAQHPTQGFFLATMLHETTHAFIDRHVARRGVLLPRWLDEGFAEYLGTSDIKGGKIVPGGHARRKVFMSTPSGGVFWQTISRLRTEEAQRAQRQKRALTLREIVAAGPETFYGKDAGLFYAQGWLAVHFLRHGRPEWTDGAFPRFLLYTAEGYPAEDALRAAYGVGPEQLETDYQRYVKSF